MLEQAKVSNPKDYAVVSFHNSTSFDFTPDMGCMYDGRPVNGISGKSGIEAGETMILPYHVGNQVAKNLAKRVLNTSPAAIVDATGIPTGVPIWSKEALETKKNEFLKELYSEAKPIAQTETDRLMAKVEEFKKLEARIDEKLGKLEGATVAQADTTEKVAEAPKFLDKQEVIAELEKRGITHDKRKTKADLEKLLA